MRIVESSKVTREVPGPTVGVAGPLVAPSVESVRDKQELVLPSALRPAQIERYVRLLLVQSENEFPEFSAAMHCWREKGGWRGTIVRYYEPLLDARMVWYAALELAAAALADLYEQQSIELLWYTDSSDEMERSYSVSILYYSDKQVTTRQFLVPALDLVSPELLKAHDQIVTQSHGRPKYLCIIGATEEMAQIIEGRIQAYVDRVVSYAQWDELVQHGIEVVQAKRALRPPTRLVPIAQRQRYRMQEELRQAIPMGAGAALCAALVVSGLLAIWPLPAALPTASAPVVSDATIERFFAMRTREVNDLRTLGALVELGNAAERAHLEVTMLSVQHDGIHISLVADDPLRLARYLQQEQIALQSLSQDAQHHYIASGLAPLPGTTSGLAPLPGATP
jgi:hypothetical protein